MCGVFIVSWLIYANTITGEREFLARVTLYHIPIYEYEDRLDSTYHLATALTYTKRVYQAPGIYLRTDWYLSSMPE